jgi:hypothetical protein
MGKLIRCAAFLLMISALVAADDMRKITLKTNDIIYDPVSHKIYASVPSSAGVNGNSITVIDPWTGAVGPAVFVGSEPNKLALSDDGQYLYVGLDGAAAVRRLHIPTLTPGLQFALGSDSFFGQYFVEDMEVLPGEPDSVAVSRRNEGVSPRHAGVAIYDNGVPRPNATPRHTGSNVIEFSASASLLYGLNNETTEFGFRRMSVDSSGVAVIDVTGSVVDEFYVDMKFDDGLIYFTTGRVFDPVTLSIVGMFSGIPYEAIVKPDSTISRTFFLTGDSYNPSRTLLSFDQRTFLSLGSLPVDGVSGAAIGLVRWGANGLAFRDDTYLFLIRTVLAPLPTPRLVPADVDGDGFQEVLADLGSAGLWLWDGAWTSLSGMNPDSMTTGDLDGSGDQELVADFGSFGLWKWDAATWSQLAGANPDGVISADIDGDAAAELVVDFAGMGVWIWDSGVWSQISGVNVDALATADVDADAHSEIIADAGTLGLWLWDSGAWTPMSGVDAQGMIAAPQPTGDAVVADFGGVGVWLWMSGVWTQLTGADPDSMVAADTDLDGVSEVAGDFGALGLWIWNGTWTQLSGRDADSMVAADIDGNGAREIVADFGHLGLWRWSGAWSQLSSRDPSAVTEANIDADLQQEIVADFGSIGIWLLDNGIWSKIR